MRSQWLSSFAFVTYIVLLGGCALVGGEQDKARERKVTLPAAAAQALQKAFPDATIGKAELESRTPKLYEVKLAVKGTRMEVTVTPDGTIAEIETEIAAKDLPAAVAKAFLVAAPGMVICKIERIEERLVIKDGKLTKLEKPQIAYEVKAVGHGKRVEIEFTADGKVLKTEEEAAHKKHGKRHKNDDNDDDDDDDGDDDDDDDDDDNHENEDDD